ncbi:MAG TPA: prolyl oligopeptidase family serine peptidase [Myxococcales bacterium]|nr:prolyl oligopeptidase family serine peptidase [Myxococcales bacterium]
MPLLLALLVSAPLAYPPAPRGNVVDDYAGHSVPAPYRWMEDLDSPAVKQWIEAENALTFSYLKAIPERNRIRERLTALWNYPRTEVPVREAGQLWYRRNAGLQKQAVLYRAPNLEVLDPNALSPDGSVAMNQWEVSPDGHWLVYSTAAGGSDVRDLHLRNLRTGKDTGEVVPRVKFSGISFTRDSRGFLYERFKGTETSAAFAAANRFHQVWYHAIGRRQPDRLIFERTLHPQDGVGGDVSDDGRWLFLSSASGTSNNRLWIEDLVSAKKPRFDRMPSIVSAEEDSIVTPLGVAGGRLYLRTTFGAQNGRIVSAAIGDSNRAHWKTVVAETKDPIRGALLVRDRLVVVRLADVQSRLALFDLAGRPVTEVQLPEAGSVSNLNAKNGDPDFFFEFTSFLRPRTVYRYELKTGALTPFQAPDAPFDASQYETRALFYPSKDGTRVPLFVTAKKGIALDGTHPTMLYGYGGFNIALQPSFSPTIAAWLELGGVWAQANLRGGSEYGEAWHHAGMREKKQNVFDDFIAAAGYLEAERWTSPQHLAIRGGSNGGLLVGAVENQRPDLFAASLPAVGVMDMLRYQKFTGGFFWVDEYGSSDEAAMVPVLLAYSPLHNVKPGCHPATLVTTADRDDRVVPSHSFQYTAAMQAAQTCDKPVLIRVEVAGSHGYRPTDRIIAESADQLAFALANLR